MIVFINNKLNVLIIEDDVSINDIEKRVLEKNGFGVIQAYSGSEGLLNCQSRKEEIDIIIMDLCLPGIDGYELLPQIKDILDVPVIVVSAISDIVDKVKLLDAGANDYITKPFDNKELLARIGVQARISQVSKLDNKAENMENVLRYRDLELFPETFDVFVCGKELILTKYEFKILELFLKNQKRIFSKQDIYEIIWGEIYTGDDRTISVHISNIRKKIGEFSDEPYIDTIWGIGFRLSK